MLSSSQVNESQSAYPDAPSEFQYFKNSESNLFKKRRAVMKRLIGLDPVLSDERVKEYGASYYDADPIAEAFVHEVYLKQNARVGRAMLDQALEEGVDSVKDAPESLKRLFQEVEKKPEWFEQEKFDLGAKVFRRFGVRLFYILGAATLESYSENSVAKPLAFTGAYDGDSTYGRFLETCSFWIDVSEPDAFAERGQGFQTAMRVRIMHVFVRKRLMEHPQWDVNAWGVPISQADALVTLMAGSYGAGMAVKLLGMRTSKKEIEAMMHFWRYVGYVMGVQPRWYPETYEEGARLLFTNLNKGVGKSGDDGVSLCQSYVKAYEPKQGVSLKKRLRSELNYRRQLGYTANFVSGHTYKINRLPKAGLWRLYPLVQFPANFLFDTIRMRSKTIDDWHDARVRKHRKSWIKKELAGKKAKFTAVERFTR